MRHCRREWLTGLVVSTGAALLGACAGIPGMEEPRVTIVGLEPLPGEGLEVRFAVKMRIQNPNNTELSFDGVVLDLDVQGRPLATGVSDTKGSVPRYGSTTLVVPVSVHTIGVVRQLLALGASNPSTIELTYSARGRLGSAWPGGTRFSAEGLLKLPM